MLEVMKNLMKSKETCVLATVSGSEPHCSLMSYAIREDCREIYMMSLKNTKKYENLLKNPSVSVLVDDREDRGPADRLHTRALTVSGRFEPAENEEAEAGMKSLLLARHPHLKEFAGNPDMKFFSVKIQSFQLLDGVADSSFIALD